MTGRLLGQLQTDPVTCLQRHRRWRRRLGRRGGRAVMKSSSQSSTAILSSTNAGESNRKSEGVFLQEYKDERGRHCRRQSAGTTSGGLEGQECTECFFRSPLFRPQNIRETPAQSVVICSSWREEPADFREPLKLPPGVRLDGLPQLMLSLLSRCAAKMGLL